MWDTIKRYLLYGDVDSESYAGVKGQMESNNRRMALVFGSVGALLISVMLTISAFQDSFGSSRPVYIAGIFCSLTILMVAHLAKYRPWLSYVAVYMAIAVFLGYGIAIATLSRPEEQTVTFMVMMIFVPLIFVDRPLRMAASLVVAIFAFILMALRTKTGNVLTVDITDALIFGFLAIVSETVVYCAKIRGYALENQLHEMSETDQLTGLKNRNCYERKLDELTSTHQGIAACVYIDANGLHELNNTQGHAAGDAMLCHVADAVRKQFGEEDSFRIGGDEFVALAYTISKDELNRNLEAFKTAIAAAGYHAAVGICYSASMSTNIRETISAAEAAMYTDKAAYYRLHDRRARQS